MTYTSFYYYLTCGAMLPLYYIIPRRFRWILLSCGSLYLYYQFCLGNPVMLLTFAFSLLISYAAGLLLEKSETASERKKILAAGIALSVLPLLPVKFLEFTKGLGLALPLTVLAPVGLSFYCLQIAAYLADIYNRKITAQKNPLRYALFVSWFPQVIQGPIPRYAQLGRQFDKGPSYDESLFHQGICQIIWGFFLKFMIADKAGLLVDTIFGTPSLYPGAYVFLGGVLYSIQLYTDFMSCVCMAKGVSGLFGVRIADNFRRPYFASSVKDFWHRWHISLSRWLRDYIYIPLGGSRKGLKRTYLNVVIVFAVSGFWHGGSPKFLYWGMLHALYQIAGSFTTGKRNLLLKKLRLDPESLSVRIFRALVTSFLVMVAWIIFRADTLTDGLAMISSMFSVRNPWVLFDGSVFEMGLDAKDCLVLFLSVLTLLASSILGARRNISAWICRQQLPVRWAILLSAVVITALMGTYGFGYKAQDFIYGGF
ncbi:MAG: MBOAT family protein [Lachnospiraceae bacterium]|nr:MBOAT family protein [Lachnospiraceae bacterium]MBQ4304874.1 MBOAT family protein [Lachnospiraceae bacterium]